MVLNIQLQVGYFDTVSGDTVTYFTADDEEKAKELGLPSTESSTVTPGGTSLNPEISEETIIDGASPNNASLNNSSNNNSGEEDPIADLIDGAAGLILYPAKALVLLLGKVIEMVTGYFVNDGESLTVDKILFNEVEITNIDFFNFNSSDTTANSIRENVAIWYYSVRNIAAVALIAIAIYVGIRMAISTVASEKAKYSSMLVNWLTSLALLFVLHYIMRIFISLNNAFVEIMKPSGELKDVSGEFFDNAWSASFTKGVGSAMAYLLLVGMALVFLFSYLKRMITIAFLIIIAPLVTVTYSIDKIGDNKSQALNTWLKEFGYNIMIQPFQCITYLAIGQTALNLLADSGAKSLGTVVIAIAMLIFIYTAEKIVRHIFHMEPRTASDTVGNAVLFTTAMSMIGKSKKGSGGGAGDSSDDGDGKNSKKTKAQQVAAKYAHPAKSANGSTQGADVASRLGMFDKASAIAQDFATPHEGDSASKAKVRGAVNKVGKAGTKIKGAAGTIGRSRILRGYAGLTARAVGVMAGISLGGATGKVDNMFTGVTQLSSLGASASDWINDQSEKASLNKAINDYQEAHPEMSRDEVKQRAIDLMNDDYDGEYSMSDFRLKAAMDDRKKRYQGEGKDSDEVIAKMDSDMSTSFEKKDKREQKEKDKKTYATNRRFTRNKSAEKDYGESINESKPGNRTNTSSSNTGAGMPNQSRKSERATEDVAKAEAETFDREDGTPI